MSIVGCKECGSTDVEFKTERGRPGQQRRRR